MAWLALTGLLSTVSQVVLLREANVAFYGVELVYLLAIGAWMLWTGIGAACDRGRVEAPSVGAVGMLVLLVGVILPADVAFLRASRTLAGAITGAYLPFPRQLAVLVIAILPVGVPLGLLFQWSARRAVAAGHTLARAYAVESAGALAGGVVTLFWTYASLSTFALAVAASTVCAGACVTAGWSMPGWVRATATVLGLGLLAGSGHVATVDRAMTRWSHPFLVESRDSPYGRLTATRAADQVTVFENDALAFETGGTDAEVLAHVAALAHPAPSRILLLGGGPEGVGRELLQHRPARIDIVEVNWVLLDLAREFVPGSLPPADAAGVTLVVDDPRRILRAAPEYDLIVVSAPEPDSGQANRFYTTEFFGLCAARLSAGGVLAFRLRTAENLWTPAQTLRFASVHRALAPHFAHVLVLPGATNVVLASPAPLPETAAPLVGRFDERGIHARLVQSAYLAYLFSSDRRGEIDASVGRAEVPANTDTEPVCYRYALVLWLGRLWPSLAGLDPREAWADRLGSQVGLAATGVVLALVWFGRRSASRRRAAFVGVIALSGMLLESVVLMHFQVTQGVMFQDVGLLVAAFMAGLAIGTWAMARDREGPCARPTHGRIVAGTLALAAVCLAFLLAASIAPTLGTASLMLAATGALVGAGFGWASLRAGADQRGAIAPLYAADLVGGGVGAVVGGVLLIPLLGLTTTMLVAGALALLALLLA
jgi:spermidine synthase